MQNQKSNLIPSILAVLVLAIDLFVWVAVVKNERPESAKAYFLNVGQGDSELIVLKSGVRILFDAGPDGSAAREIENIVGPNDRYIDVGVITHPQTDHYGGYKDMLDRYEFGAIVTNGENSDSLAWKNLLKNLKVKGIPIIPLGSGGEISAIDGSFEALAPVIGAKKAKNANEDALVGIMYTSDFSVFLSSDMDAVVEKELLSSNAQLKADILKIAHHGSKYSSTKEFLDEVAPAIGVIEVGRNSYGHPTAEAMLRVGDAGAEILRTDLDRSIYVTRTGEELRAISL